MNNKITKLILIIIIILLITGIILLSINIFKKDNQNTPINIEEPVIEEKHYYVETIDFINKPDKLDKNTIYNIELSILPENAENKEVTFNTTDPNICTINNNGTLKTINKGNCVINVESTNNIKSSLIIEIYNSRELKGFNVDKDNYTIEVNKDFNININTDPGNAEYNSITCTSSDTSIFTTTVNNKTCVLKGIKSGNANLTIKVDDFSKTGNIKSITKETINVATLNIGRGNKYKNLTHTSFSNYLKGLDIIGLQEARDSNGTEKLVKNIASDLGLKYYYGTKAPAGNAVISKYNFIEKTETKLSSPSETRTIIKTVFNINNVNISFYDTHIVVSKHEGGSCTASIEDTSKCPYRTKELKEINKMIQNDPNPVIIVADWNFLGNQWFSMLGNNLIKVGYDTIRNKDYDSIWIIPKDRIEYVSNDTKETREKVTDHNLVISKLNIIN